MGMAFRLMLLVLSINFAVGILAFVGGADNWTLHGVSTTAYNESTNQLQTLYNSSATVPVTNVNVVWYKSILDLISLGFFSKIVNFLQQTIYALPTLLSNIGVISYGFVGILDSILTVLYIMGMWELFTGRDLTWR